MKKILIVPNMNRDIDLKLTYSIIDILKQKSELYVLNNTDIENINVITIDELSIIDFVITVGGDGTILGIATECAKNNIPIIGINMGHLGFMTELEPNDINMLLQVISGNYSIEKRMMLDVTIQKNDGRVMNYYSLNDVVAGKGVISKMADLKLYCDDVEVSDFHSDGLIISTPTGSTAYSLSAGGAIIDPCMNCIIMTPVCPHSFYNSRPIIFSSAATLKIINSKEFDENTYVTIDGRINEKLEYGDIVSIKKSDCYTSLIKVSNSSFYDLVYKKISERR